MKGYNRLFLAVMLIYAVLTAGVNICLSRSSGGASDSGQFRVDTARIVRAIEAGEDPEAEDYPEVAAISEYDGSEDFYSASDSYVIREAGGRLYRIDRNETGKSSGIRTGVNLALAGGGILIAGVMLYLRSRIIRPFNEISSLPYELAKGNLTVPLKEHKSRYFGRFIWGLDMLREELETARRERLEQVRDEKTMLLSLSHDIKTPLSAIRLYAGALEKELYADREKQRSAAANITARADEISGCVGELISSLSGDFMEFDVQLTEFYMSEVVDRIIAYYRDKLSDLGTELSIGKTSDCVLTGDPVRLEEVLQNILENAVKYGDGGRISIDFSDEEDCRLITVSNTGCTLPEAELSHIFESFWRGSNAGDKPGNGLGLYICRKLMNASGGEVFAVCKDGEIKVTAVCRKAG